MFSGERTPLQNLLGVAFRFLWHPKVSLMSSSLGLKETFGGVVTELGRSRPPHNAKATKGHGRGPPCGKARRRTPLGGRRPPAAGIGRTEPPKERRRRGHVVWPRRPKKERPPGRTAAEPLCGEGQRAALLRSQRKIIL